MITCITKPTREKVEAVTELCSMIVVLIKFEANGNAREGTITCFAKPTKRKWRLASRCVPR